MGARAVEARVANLVPCATEGEAQPLRLPSRDDWHDSLSRVPTLLCGAARDAPRSPLCALARPRPPVCCWGGRVRLMWAGGASRRRLHLHAGGGRRGGKGRDAGRAAQAHHGGAAQQADEQGLGRAGAEKDPGATLHLSAVRGWATRARRFALRVPFGAWREVVRGRVHERVRGAPVAVHRRRRSARRGRSWSAA